MRAHHYAVGREFGYLRLNFYSFRTKVLKHSLIMHQVAEDGDWSGFSLSKRECNGVSNPKTHAKVGCADYFHVNKIAVLRW
jgi:hypothetical protein